MSVYLSMAAFALASSISPGPVNLVALSAGAQHGLRAGLRHVTGATVGFTALLLLIGLGLNELIAHSGYGPSLMLVLRWGGLSFLVYMAWQLARSDGKLGSSKSASSEAQRAKPSYLYGATMQWLNPKAWIASLAGMAAYASSGDGLLVWQFAAIYFVICYASLASWAWAGASLRRHLNEPRKLMFFNRTLAAFLLLAALYMV
ncbi:LysE family translocator [Roseateles albus]|uniref:LysE family translocator n=1 Tax=Roseateles albus TaxID=2987525 RepID=A0ABT5KFB8_9BURK|nr:LysE family translocator [Roseateles albus]MDC8772623.1 LysE family translocator [Roseateles albus]